jgi:hypothetical protein
MGIAFIGMLIVSSRMKVDFKSVASKFVFISKDRSSNPLRYISKQGNSGRIVDLEDFTSTIQSLVIVGASPTVAIPDDIFESFTNSKRHLILAWAEMEGLQNSVSLSAAEFIAARSLEMALGDKIAPVMRHIGKAKKKTPVLHEMLEFFVEDVLKKFQPSWLQDYASGEFDPLKCLCALTAGRNGYAHGQPEHLSYEVLDLRRLQLMADSIGYLYSDDFSSLTAERITITSTEG